MRVDAIGYSPPVAVRGLSEGETGAAQAGRAFMEYLNDAIRDVSDMQTRAAELQQAFARGEYENVHEVIIAAQEAGIALDLVLAIRNQVVRAYEEIMRMQI
jgi:flagellar hook-basal body complex protein FliE